MEEEVRLLDWQLGEKLYIDKRVDNYLEEQSKIPLGFMLSQKKLNKYIAEIKDKASREFRERKLQLYQWQLEEERKRIDKTIEEINDKLNAYIKNIKGNINKEIKPFKIEVQEYNGSSPLNITPTEIYKIKCEPFEIAFIQEKTGGSNEH